MKALVALIIAAGLVAAFLVYRHDRRQGELVTCSARRDVAACLELYGWSEHDALLAELDVEAHR